MKKNVYSSETSIGIDTFFTDCDGIGGKLRLLPDDFIVHEVSKSPPHTEDGIFTIIRAEANNWETNRLVRCIARQLGISRKRIGFAGTKDKRAITVQFFSIRCDLENIKKLRLKGFKILEIYKSNKPVEIGDLIANKFTVKVSNLDVDVNSARVIIEDVKHRILDMNGFPNFYGVQRFGAIRPITHLVGKYIVKSNFKNAVHTYLGAVSDYEPPEVCEARKYFLQTFDYGECIKRYPVSLNFERAILNYLLKKPSDYIGALKQLPTNLLMMFVHAYQAYIFNRILSVRLKKGLPLNEALIGDIVLPVDKDGLPAEKTDYIMVGEQNISKINTQLKKKNAFISGLVIGYKTKFAAGMQGEIENEIVMEEDVVANDFIIPAIPELSSKGMRRALIAPVNELEYELLHNSVIFKFTLPRGCYATVLLREFMKTTPINY